MKNTEKSSQGKITQSVRELWFMFKWANLQVTGVIKGGDYD